MPLRIDHVDLRIDHVDLRVDDVDHRTRSYGRFPASVTPDKASYATVMTWSTVTSRTLSSVLCWPKADSAYMLRLASHGQLRSTELTRGVTHVAIRLVWRHGDLRADHVGQ